MTALAHANHNRSPKSTIPLPRSARWLLLKEPDENDPPRAVFLQRFLESLIELCPEASLGIRKP
jgi:hypothetical protein